MTTDNTQAELDEILENVFMSGLGIAGADDINPEDKDTAILNTQKHYVAEAKQAILDLQNKQIEEVLDRLELSMGGKTIVDTPEGWRRFFERHVHGAIEAERNKLKESK